MTRRHFFGIGLLLVLAFAAGFAGANDTAPTPRYKMSGSACYYDELLAEVNKTQGRIVAISPIRTGRDTCLVIISEDSQ